MEAPHELEDLQLGLAIAFTGPRGHHPRRLPEPYTPLRPRPNPLGRPHGPAGQKGGGGRSSDYGGTGERLSEKCRFSYLFPAQKEGERYLAWLPRYEDAEGRGLVWHREDNEGNKKADREFRLWMLTVRPGTAISPSTDAALEATLREYELLADWSFWGKQKFPSPFFSRATFSAGKPT